MAMIYARAERTLIWLGEETSDVKGWARAPYAYQRFFAEDPFTKDLSRLPQDKDAFRKYQAKRLMLGLDNAFTTVHGLASSNIHMRSWFTRKWVIQEVVKSRHPVLVCGSERVPWEMWENNTVHMFRY
jgi:hypothetical protein